MKFDIQDTDNNRVIIEANNDVEAINKFFDLYPNSSLGTIGIVVEDIIKLSYEQWVEKYGSKLKDTEWDTAEDIAQDFFAQHGKDINEYIEQMNKDEYRLYLERLDAGLEM